MNSEQPKGHEQLTAIAVADLMPREVQGIEKSKPAAELEKSFFKEWANSPFVVTVLGGLVLAAVTWFFQSMQSYYSRVLAKHDARAETAKRIFEQEYNDRKAVRQQFINEFPAAHDRLYRYIYAYTWVIENKGRVSPSNTIFGLNLTQMCKKMEKLNEERVHSKVAESFVADIIVTYTNIEVLKISKNLQHDIDALYNSDHITNANSYNTKLDATYEKLCQAMTSELKYVHEQYLQKISNE